MKSYKYKGGEIQAQRFVPEDTSSWPDGVIETGSIKTKEGNYIQHPRDYIMDTGDGNYEYIDGGDYVVEIDGVRMPMCSFLFEKLYEQLK